MLAVGYSLDISLLRFFWYVCLVSASMSDLCLCLCNLSMSLIVFVFMFVFVERVLLCFTMYVCACLCVCFFSSHCVSLLMSHIFCLFPNDFESFGVKRQSFASKQ